MPTSQNLAPNQTDTISGSENITINSIGTNATLISKGSGNLEIRGQVGEGAEILDSGLGNLRIYGEIDQKVKLVSNGSGSVYIDGNVGSNLSVAKRGSGNMTFAIGIADRSEFDLKGSGNLTIPGSVGKQLGLKNKGSGDIKIGKHVGDEAIISLNGSGRLEIGGNVGRSAKFITYGHCMLHFGGTLPDDVEFQGELIHPVRFNQRPSDTVLNEIKAAQNRALTSGIGFNYYAGYQIKCGSGWVRINENGVDTLYVGNKFEIINGVKYMDGRPVDAASANPSSPPKLSPFSRLNRFANQHPIAFIFATLGLGLLWYFGKFLTSCCTYKHSSLGRLSINCERQEGPDLYYLADVSGNNVGAKGNSSKVILDGLNSTPVNPQTEPNGISSTAPVYFSNALFVPAPDLQVPRSLPASEARLFSF